MHIDLKNVDATPVKGNLYDHLSLQSGHNVIIRSDILSPAPVPWTQAPARSKEDDWLFLEHHVANGQVSWHRLVCSAGMAGQALDDLLRNRTVISMDGSFVPVASMLNEIEA